MNDSLLIDTKYIGNHRIKIYNDIDNDCPVKAWDMGAFHLFEHLEHGRYWLSSQCDYDEWVSDTKNYSLNDILMRIASKYVSQDDIIKSIKAGEVNDVRFEYDRHERVWELQTYLRWKGKEAKWSTSVEIEPSDLKTYDYRDELLEPFDEEDLLNLLNKYAKDLVIKSWGSCGYSQGDHMRGYSYMTKEMLEKRSGHNEKVYPNWKDQANEIIDGEVKCIEMWAWGDVKGYVLEKKVPFTKVFHDEDREDEECEEWEEVDSCWGYYMKTEELIAEVIAEHDLKEVA